MMKRTKKAVAVLLALTMMVTSFVTGGVSADAAKKPSLSVSKKLTIYKGSTKTVTIKNVKAKKVKSLKWTTKSKKIATVKKSSNTKAKIKGVKAGKTTITCKFKVKSKKYTFKVTVTVKNKPATTTTPTTAPSSPSVTPGQVAPTDAPNVTPTPVPNTEVVTEKNKPDAAKKGSDVVYSEDFSDGPGKFKPRGPEGTQIKLETADYGYDGKCMLVRDRYTMEADETTGEEKMVGQSWSGAQVSLKECGAEPGKSYIITAWAMSLQTVRDPGAAMNDFKRGVVLSKIEVDADGKESSSFSGANIAETQWISDKFGVKRGTWVKLQANVTMPSEGDLTIYFETPGVSLVGKYENGVKVGQESVNFFLDSFSVEESVGNIDTSTLPSLADSYRGLLNLGTALNSAQFKDTKIMADVVRQFKGKAPDVVAATGGSITLGNELKPSSILGGEAELVDASTVTDLPASYKEEKVPVLNFDNIDETLKIAKQYGFKLRGHVLVWHSQTSDWFFRQDYDSTKKFVSKEVMDARLEWYIKTVLTHMKNTEGGDLIYCWDVANEVFKDSGDLRAKAKETNKDAIPTDGSSKWMTIYGSDEFIVNAFKYARQYAGEGVELYYNDYNEYVPSKRDAIYNLAMKLKSSNLIDGIGMQMHLTQGNTGNSVQAISEAIDKFASTGLKVQITELDMGRSKSSNSTTFAAAYRELFEMLVQKKDKLDKVVIWGINDEGSWRKESYPTLWRVGFQPKKCFWEVVNAGRKALGLEELTYTTANYYEDTEVLKPKN